MKRDGKFFSKSKCNACERRDSCADAMPEQKSEKARKTILKVTK